MDAQRFTKTLVDGLLQSYDQQQLGLIQNLVTREGLEFIVRTTASTAFDAGLREGCARNSYGFPN